MKAWLLDELGGLQKLRLGTVPDPKAGKEEVVLQVLYAALNPADRYLSEGQYPARPAFPHVLGRDGVGTIVEVGEGVSDVRLGDRLAVLRGETGVSRWGTFAERVTVAAQSLVKMPEGWTEQQAAGATLVYLTAYQALTQWGALRPGVVLLSGASGGVGVASIQLGVAKGHTVIALSRGAGKREQLINIGAAAVFDPSDGQWVMHLKKFLGDRRVDLGIDNIGGTLLPQMIETLGEHGKVSLVGRLAGPVPQFNTASVFFRRIRLGGVAVGAYKNAESHGAWEDVLRLLSRTGARPLVDRVFRFEELPAAFARLAEGPMGKVLLAVA